MTTDRAGMRRGFTLPEAMLAMVILGMAAAGVLLPFSGGAAVQAEGMHRTLAAQLANDLMEQIVAPPHDNILAWNGYTEAQGQVKDTSGTVFTDPMYAGFSREATCEAIWIASASSLPANFVFITVTVARQGTEVVTLSSLINK